MDRERALWTICVIDWIYAAMTFLAWHIHLNTVAFNITVLIGVLGVVCGWLAGALSSPSNPNEADKFNKYAGIVSGFISGYLLSKIDGFLSTIFSNLLNPLFATRVIIFVVTFVTGILMMYSFRAYLQCEPPIKKRPFLQRNLRRFSRI